jgi:hypothetical protein
MREGFTLDHGHGKRFVTAWIAGVPEYGFFGNPKVLGREQHPVRTFRCDKCGYLESYTGRE